MSVSAPSTRKKAGESRVPTRMPQAVYEKITEAAALQGATLNQFLVSAALDKANAILEKERVLKLDFDSAKTVLDLITTPPEPNDALKSAMRKRRELLEDSPA